MDSDGWELPLEIAKIVLPVLGYLVAICIVIAVLVGITLAGANIVTYP